MAKHSARLVFGVVLILLGVIFLLPNLDLPLFGWGNIWPFFIILGGLAFLLGWVLSPGHDEGLAFVGTGTLLVGVFLALFAWDILSWWEMGKWWPGFPLIGGLAFLALWAAGRAEDPGVLVPALGGIAIGGVAFLFTFGLVGLEIAARWWPLLIMALGVAILASRLFGRKGAKE
ncbi:MAG: LiaI-LiaF-like domain-containing protein [Patescibacteria group bacterium]